MPWQWNGTEFTDEGRALNDEGAVRLIDIYIDRAWDQVFTPINNLLIEGRITVNQWKLAFGGALKDLYINLGCLAAGGRDQMTQEYWGSIGGRLGRQYGYLDAFAQEIAQGNLTPGVIRRRARMYANSSRQAYWGIRDMRAREQGYTEERWVAIGDDATCSPCADADAMGWQPIGTFKTPGSGLVTAASTCRGLTSCRCRKVYR